MRWSFLLVATGMFAGCGRRETVGSSSEPPAAPPVPLTFLGYPLGVAEQTIIATLGEGELKDKDGERVRKYKLRWLDREWDAGLRFGPAGLEGGFAELAPSTKEQGKDIQVLGRSMCAALGVRAVPVVAFSSGEDRYEVSFREWTKSHAAVGCWVEAEEVFALSMVADDASIVLLTDPRVESSRKVLDFFRSALVPFDWDGGKHIDDPIDLGGFRYVVDSVRPKGSVGKNPFLKKVAADGASYVVVRYSIENVGMETATAFANDLVIRDPQGRIFRPASDATTTLAADEGVDLLLSQLHPSVPRKQIAVFEVPKTLLDRFELVIPEKGLLGTKEAVLPLTFWEAPPKK